MGSLGELGTPRAAVDLDFVYFGHTIRVNPDATDLDVADMLATFGEMDDEEQAKDAMTGLAEMLVQQIHPDDRFLFWETAKRNRQQVRDIMAVSKAITEAVAGFPTGQLSDSSTGPAPIAERSEGASSNRASRRQAMRARRTVERRRAAVPDALSAMRDRPDKQVGLLQLHGLMPHPEEREVAG